MGESGEAKGRVAVIGGGVAGLSTAHQLVRQGYEVHVIERRGQKELGGKAWSYTFGPPPPGCAPEQEELYAAAGLPGEHGFRFFPGFYAHVIDTMGQIKCMCDAHPQGEKGDHVVSDHLVELDTADLIRASRKDPDVEARTITRVQLPVPTQERSPSLRKMASAVAPHLASLPNPREAYAASKVLTRLVTACPERWQKEYEERSWWDMSEAWVHGPRYSEWFAKGLTRTFVATKAEEMSGRTGGKILLQLLYDVAFPDGRASADRVLDGPTSKVWIKEWHGQLTREGVQFHLGHELRSVTIEDGRVTGIHTNRTADANGSATDPPETGWDHVVLAVSVKTLKTLLSCEMSQLVELDPDLLGVFNLHTRWMSGAFFYLTEKDLGTMEVSELPTGHTIFLDSEWALTMIEQRHLWQDKSLLRFDTVNDPLKDIVAIMSVDVSDWDSPGERVPPAERPQPGEWHEPGTAGDRTDLRDEIWKQIRNHLPKLAEATPKLSAIDVSITINKYKKTGISEGKATFSEGMLDQEVVPVDPTPVGKRAVQVEHIREAIAAAEVRPHVDKTVKRHNADELLVNTTHSWADRPTSATKILNLFLAGDYVRTCTDFASMEAADESGRRAANAILMSDGHDPACVLWPLRSPNRWWYRGVQEVASTVDHFVTHPLRVRAPFRLPMLALAAGAAIDGTVGRLFHTPKGPQRIAQRTDGSPTTPVIP